MTLNLFTRDEINTLPTFYTLFIQNMSPDLKKILFSLTKPLVDNKKKIKILNYFHRGKWLAKGKNS